MLGSDQWYVSLMADERRFLSKQNDSPAGPI